MNTPDLSEASLIKYRDDSEYILKTARQIKKDFALFGLPINMSRNENLKWQGLFVELEKQIRALLESNSVKILSLLYQIDIPEEKIRREAERQKERILSEVVSEMIMERELKKVLTRKYFSSLK